MADDQKVPIKKIAPGVSGLAPGMKERLDKVNDLYDGPRTPPSEAEKSWLAIAPQPKFRRGGPVKRYANGGPVAGVMHHHKGRGC